MQRIELINIDPQIDFCVPNGTYQGMKSGALLVPGAHDDMKRLGPWVKKNVKKINSIKVTLDCHQRLDVAHKWFWKDGKGNHPLPLSEALVKNGMPTFISSKDVRDGVWTPVIPSLIPRMIKYTEALENSGKFALTIWDDHCIIGTPGAAIVPELQEALDFWCQERFKNIEFLTKGSNPFTEHYGAFAAEVPDPTDPGTQLQTNLIKSIEDNDMIIWAGEASTHCVLTTMKQAFSIFGPSGIEKSHLMIDAMSGIPTFEKPFQDFLDEYTKKGLKIVKTTDFLL